MIPYGKHYIDDDDINGIVDLLRNGTLTQGIKVDEFEEAFAEYVGAKYAVSCSNGTAALHLACLAAEIGQDDQVITSANTFISDANCIRFVGAIPIFADIDVDTMNISVESIKSILSVNNNVKALIPVHFAGQPCDIEKIHEISRHSELIIIEDGCHALGGAYPCGSKVGSCKFSDMTCFSFHPVKSIATGEGGMISTNDKVLYRKLLMLRSHGVLHQKLLKNKNFDSLSFENVTSAYEDTYLNPWYFEMQSLGYNYRLSEIQCALGLSQLKKLDMFINKRRDLAIRYDDKLKNVVNIKPIQSEGRFHSAHHLYVVKVNFNELTLTKNQMIRSLLEKGIGCQVHYIPIPLHPYYQNMGYNLKDYPNTDRCYKEVLSLPLFYSLTYDQQDMIVREILDFLCI